MKKVLPCVLVGFVLLMVSCATMSEAEKNVTITNAMFNAFNQHDWQSMASFYSENASFLDPSYGTDYVVKTRQEIAAKYVELEKALPDIHDEIIGIYPSGDKVTVEFVSTAKISDTLAFRLPIVAVLTFKNGLIVKDATYYDQENP